jgi:extradiol dioxygenase family protein
MMSVTQLGYLGLGVSDLAAWEQFATQTLGLQANGRDEEGTLFLKMDEYHHRFALHANDSDDVIHVGWEVADEQALANSADPGITLTPAACNWARSACSGPRLTARPGISLTS